MSPLQQTIVALKSQGWRTPDIAQRMGLSKEFVQTCLKGPKKPRKQNEWVISLRARGDRIRAAIMADPSIPTREFARQFGVSKPRISQLRRQIREQGAIQ